MQQGGGFGAQQGGFGAQQGGFGAQQGGFGQGGFGGPQGAQQGTFGGQPAGFGGPQAFPGGFPGQQPGFGGPQPGFAGQQPGFGGQQLTMCGFCKVPINISGEAHLRAFNMFWHPNHLKCYTCQNDFSSPDRKVREGPDGFAYCEQCFMNKFAPKCSSCQQVVTSQAVNIKDKLYHKQCFVCSKCKQALTAQFYFLEDGSLACERHYYDAKGLLCGGCEQPIVSGKAIPFGNKKYHPDHFTCSHCKTKLNNQQFSKKDEKPYCVTCYRTLFG